jgi:uncharacterized protein (TIGR00255 family)
MIQSMTGYGTGSSQCGSNTVTVEIRTVNHRFLDLHVRVPREHAYLENEIQPLVRNTLGRGRVDLNVSIASEAPPEFLVNPNAVRSYLDAAALMRDQFRLTDTLDVKTLFTLPGVLQNREAGQGPAAVDGALLQAVLQGVRQGLEAVVRMRKHEGEALRAEMSRHLESIREKAESIGMLAPAAVGEYRRRLEERLAQLLPENGLDPQRVVQEVALMADRSDIAEEVARLASHVGQYASLMESGAQTGKKLDFLLQEMQREINTVLSKSSSLEISRLGIAVKSDIEKLREQVQNVE